MLLDELLTGFNRIAHQVTHRALGLSRIVNAHLKQGARRRFHGGLPKLIGIHLSEALVTLNVEFFRTAHFGKHGSKRTFVVNVALYLRGAGVLLLDTENRRAGDVDIAAVDQFGHIAIEEREQQDADMGAVDIRIGHDDDAMVTRLVGIEILADIGADRRDQRTDRVAGKRTVKARAFDIEDLASQRKNCLRLSVARLLRSTACRVTLYDEDFRL